MTVLVALATPEYFRYYDDTLRLLADRGHRVVVAVNRQRAGKARLDQAEWSHANLEFVGEVPPRGDLWAAVARGLRGLTDFSRYLDSRYAGSPALRSRMRRKVLPAAFRWLDLINSMPRPALRAWLRLLSVLESAIPSSRAVAEFIASIRPDLVFVTPLLDFGSAQVDIVKSARRSGIPTAVGIASWDNLTNKGLLRIIPDRVFVWNEVQAREASALHDVPAARIVITGAQPFDRWFGRSPSLPRDRFCAIHALDAAYPIILYTCSSSFIASAASELAFVRDWIRALRDRSDLRDANVLVRPHPYNVWDWETADFSGLGRVAMHPRRAYNPLDETARTSLFDALAHAGAVVGLNTSAMIEAAILARPVLSIRAHEFSATQQGTMHFHHLLPANGGFLQMSDSMEEHLEQLADALVRPDAHRARANSFVSSFLRPHGVDVACTPILAQAIQAAGQLDPEPAPGPAVALLRPFLLILAALAWPFAEIASEKPFGALKKRTRMSWTRGRKQVTSTILSLRKHWI